MPVGHQYGFFGKIIRSSAHFLLELFACLILSFMSSLHIVDINPLSDKPFANIFFHFVGCLFILLMVSFAVQKLFSLMQSYLFIFAFVFLDWGDRSKKKKLLRLMSDNILLMFSSVSFMLSGLTFKSLTHFEFIFIYGVRKWPFHSFVCSCSVFPTPFIAETVFSLL